MIGFLGLMTVLLSLIAVISYWISWDLQPSQNRPTFMAKVRLDLAELLSRYAGSGKSTAMHSPPVTAARAR